MKTTIKIYIAVIVCAVCFYMGFRIGVNETLKESKVEEIQPLTLVTVEFEKGIRLEYYPERSTPERDRIIYYWLNSGKVISIKKTEVVNRIIVLSDDKEDIILPLSH